MFGVKQSWRHCGRSDVRDSLPMTQDTTSHWKKNLALAYCCENLKSGKHKMFWLVILFDEWRFQIDISTNIAAAERNVIQDQPPNKYIFKLSGWREPLENFSVPSWNFISNPRRSLNCNSQRFYSQNSVQFLKPTSLLGAPIDITCKTSQQQWDWRNYHHYFKALTHRHIRIEMQFQIS